jgi:hypothetical protein
VGGRVVVSYVVNRTGSSLNMVVMKGASQLVRISMNPVF